VLAATRRRQILQRLQSDGYVEAKELAVHLDVDSSTIRRDLDALAKAGQIHRTHGGARPVPHASGDIPYAVKQTEYRAEKAAIAIAAASRVRDGDTVILDSGSTTYEVATRLRDRHQLTVITNDLRIAKYVATMPDTRLLVTGGELLGAVYTLVGERAVDFLADYTADWTFLGADALHPDSGITNTNTLEVPLKRTMARAATATVVVADSSKFGQRALTKVIGLHEVDLVITDAGLTARAATAYDTDIVRATVNAPEG
jgi:DeoR family transcriptional regulator, aga operon transcriptional repressor